MLTKADFQYLRYVLRHKWAVVRRRRCVGVGLLQALLHDNSKFRPSEWSAYRDWFYAGGIATGGKAFQRACVLHISRNKHHPQHWIVRRTKDRGVTQKFTARVMPKRYAREMVLDWHAMPGGAVEYYAREGETIMLHTATRVYVKWLLANLKLREC